MKLRFLLFILFIIVETYSINLSTELTKWEISDFIGFDKIADQKGKGDITSTYAKFDDEKILLRITFDEMIERLPDNNFQDNFTSEHHLFVKIWNNTNSMEKTFPVFQNSNKVKRLPELNYLEIKLSNNKKFSRQNSKIAIKILEEKKVIDSYQTEMSRNYRGGNCAFVHHGNQGLTYTEVFRGQYPQDDSGFDEVMELHQTTGVPGNFHMSGTLMNAAEWHDPSFNDWLRNGISSGWVAMLTSAYGQHIMPFLDNSMNDWSVSTQKNMIQYIYNYDAKVAWVPERVWLSPDIYPNSGVIDWLGDNWTQHGVEAVLLDDWPHCSGNSSTKIHWMNNNSGIVLRVIPMNGNFTGNVHYDPDAAKNQINSTGQYDILTYGTDWEVVAEMNEHNGTDFLENYTNVIWYCHDNYPAVNVWKLDSAIANSDFNGWGIDVQNGTYGLLGGADGYGGNNNSWYSNWSSTTSHSDFHDPDWDYGTVWWNTFQNIINAPDNNLNQLGWFTMMTNLHETGWHDGDPPQISGWIHRYSSHIKNANVYAEAARWYNGNYAITTNAFMSDIDLDGGDELIIHNDKIFMVFEGIGGKANWIFSKDCNGMSVVGSDNVYWSETDGDYNESSNNHFAALSDVSPNHQHDIYSFAIDYINAEEAQISLYHGVIHKIIRLHTGNDYAEVVYYAGNTDVYIKSGWTPDYFATLWNVNWERVWDNDIAYMGQKNANTGGTVAYVLNNGGASHNGTFEGTFLKGDEIKGYDRFKFLLYAGWTDNDLSQLENLQTLNLDEFPPHLSADAQIWNSNIIRIFFDEAIDDVSGENISNYQLSNFSSSYNIDHIERQADWSVFHIVLQENLIAGDSGEIIVNDVLDLNGNAVADNSTANVSVPNGITPHQIFIDGVLDFDPTTELIATGPDSLYFTWDEDFLYLGLKESVLNDSSDLFVNIDVDQASGSGATSGSWNRVDFALDYLPEYQIAIEGGGNSIQLNSWSDQGWNYSHYPTNGCNSYEGWTDVPYTEISVPWSGLGDPTGIALSVHVTEEDNHIVTQIFPSNNEIGDHPEIINCFMFYPPEIIGNMPLMGFETHNVNHSDLEILLPPQNVQVEVINDSIKISWENVAGASSYKIFAADFPTQDPCTWSLVAENITVFEYQLPIMTNRKFYFVKAID